ncbi:glycosyltransferase [Paraglaciecola aquimarina]|uniref:Glycosyltransferase n=1 Tax=Paraglaciecola algarum TaxID=3050085 RepID=A0ABS9DAZ5_9ALTE|nr:glycosyltransferase [Paraglaciecola sp. G1-23]MCF2949894.1 glycosyltransferase [Paraglaciecola sp. G1-23]
MSYDISELDVGIVHDWLPLLGGAEKVVQQFVSAFPESEIYTLFNFLSEEDTAFLNAKKINVSKLNKLPFVERYYRNMLLMCTRHIEQFDVSKHDIVLSSSAALAKGVLTSVDQPHISYIHSPARYAWDLSHEYINDIQGRFTFLKREIAKELIYRFRAWDARSINTVDTILANSNFIQRRIYKVYKRKSKVIYPPVNIDKFSLNTDTRENYYVTASRLVAYKKIDLIVKAFTKKTDQKLVVIGDGPELANLKRIATPNIEFVGYQELDDMIKIIQLAKAFVFAAFEDFGILPVEAQACGTPVICYGFGGTSETVKPLGQSENPTGVWFLKQDPEHILEAVEKFEQNIDKFSETECRKNAEYFSNERFRNEITDFIGNGMENGFDSGSPVL